MPPTDLDLCSTRELIEALVRRTTFLGIVVHSGQEHRGPWQHGERSFHVHYNANLDDSEARRLLAVVSEQLDRFEA
jgi:hypothetical protein